MFLFRDFTLDSNKEIRVALRQIYGVGWRKAIYVTSRIGLGYPFYLNKINAYNYGIIVFLLKFLVVSDVRIKRRVDFDIAKMVDTSSVKGLRHKLCLPFTVNVRILMLVRNVLSDRVVKILLWVPIMRVKNK